GQRTSEESDGSARGARPGPWARIHDRASFVTSPLHGGGGLLLAKRGARGTELGRGGGDMRAIVMASVALLATTGCIGNSSGECETGERCVCNGIGNCDRSCPEG